MEPERALCSRSRRRARTSSGGSSSQVKGEEGVSLSYVCPVSGIRLKTASGGFQHCTGRSSATGARRAAAQYDRNPKRVLVIPNSTDRRDSKVYRAHAAPQGMCDNWAFLRSSSWQTSRKMATGES